MKNFDLKASPEELLEWMREDPEHEKVQALLLDFSKHKLEQTVTFIDTSLGHDNIVAQLLKSQLYQHHKKWGSALEMLKNARRKLGKNPRTNKTRRVVFWYIQALYAKKGRFDVGCDFCDKLIALNKDDIQAYKKKTRYLIAMQAYAFGMRHKKFVEEEDFNHVRDRIIYARHALKNCALNEFDFPSEKGKSLPTMKNTDFFAEKTTMSRLDAIVTDDIYLHMRAHKDMS